MVVVATLVENRQAKPLQGSVHILFILAWVLLFVLLSYFFTKWLQPKPARVTYQQTNDYHEVIIPQDRQHHYRLRGKINDKPVIFLIDTGASDVSIPASVAKRLQLKRGYPLGAQTAAGRITVYLTRLSHLEIGSIELFNIKANINPHMSGNTILLGMSALKHLELIQRNGTLVLRQALKGK